MNNKINAELLHQAQLTIRNYPLIDADGYERFVRYPIKNYKGKWNVGDVLHNGYQPVPAAIEFELFEDCLIECLRSNKLHGYSRSDTSRIVGASMDNTARLN
jgi:hypothetical protein